MPLFSGLHKNGMVFLPKPAKYICDPVQSLTAYPLLSLTCQDIHSMVFFLLSQALSEGMLLLGCIKEVTDYELAISLPNGLSGFVPVTQISDAYGKLLTKQVAQGELLEVRPRTGAVLLLAARECC